MDHLVIEGSENNYGITTKVKAHALRGVVEVIGDVHKFTKEELAPLEEWIQGYQQVQNKLLTWVFNSNESKALPHSYFPPSARLKAFYAHHLIPKPSPITELLATLKQFDFYIDGGDYHPQIAADTARGWLKLSGEFYSSYSIETVEPIHYWLDQYLARPGRKLLMEFWMGYINTSATRRFLEILEILASYQEEKSGQVKADWYFLENDLDLQELGEEFQEQIELEEMQLPFELKEISAELWEKMNKNPY